MRAMAFSDARYSEGRVGHWMLHRLLDPVVVEGPWIAAGGLSCRRGRKLVRALRR
jgi:hypothetical protein